MKNIFLFTFKNLVILYFQTNLTVQTGKDVKEIIKKDHELIKERDKENKELSPSLTTATSTITTVTVTDTSKDTKRHDAGKTLQNVNIPKFYYPYGKPINKEETEKILDKVSKEFSKLEGGKALLHNFGPITKVCIFDNSCKQKEEMYIFIQLIIILSKVMTER